MWKIDYAKLLGKADKEYWIKVIDHVHKKEEEYWMIDELIYDKIESKSDDLDEHDN